MLKKLVPNLVHAVTNHKTYIINHYGVMVNSDVPTTGVVNNNSVEWLYDELADAINLSYEAYLKEKESIEEKDLEEDTSIVENEEDDYGEDDYFESDSGDTLLIGSWKKGENGLYESDTTGEYSAIVSESVTQVVWSKHTKRGALCSPCYPGQVDLDSEGEYLGYCLPNDLMGIETWKDKFEVWWLMNVRYPMMRFTYKLTHNKK